ncbi:MAG: acyl-CoA dehydrogenase family protein [Chloroflexi bacterium]|nr:acyl-CoA dehydrogenase family protein [Chloroflexota bacterium]
MESQRRLSEPVVRGMADAGIFKAYYPRSVGGLEIDPLAVMEVVEEISRADGSAGWSAMITCVAGNVGGRLKNQVALKLFGQSADVRVAGSVIPRGEAQPVDGGFRVSGRFTFASGIDYANWLVCHCIVFDDQGPKLSDDGIPQTLIIFLPKEEADVRETWTAAGMCATRSHDFYLHDVFIPGERTLRLSDQPEETGPLFNPRTMLVYFWGPFATCLLGIGRGAMDTFLESVAGSGTNMSPTPIRDRPAVHAAVGNAEAALSSARAYVYDAIGNVWKAACNGELDLSQEIAQARLAVAIASRESARAIDLLFEAAGTTAVYASHPMERYHRDIHVATKHLGGSPANFEMAGQVLLGLKPAGPGW